MPQMAPLNWLSLMIYFILVFLILNSMNFYTFIYPSKTSKTSGKSLIKINWKWL
uniref:ATP synthase complex subunit 8 n=1 Tax=Mylabris aulica TaxID=1914941 RepID=A0A343A7G6_9CUCU|nr:ATP synthase F0 subunit 8 [Mylabris aulica]APB02820.1 ATP synthase F0 subunit 8 [Mylabris aulica]